MRAKEGKDIFYNLISLKMNNSYKLFSILIALIFSSNAYSQPFNNDPVSARSEITADETSGIIYSVILVGETGAAYTNEAMIEMLETHLKQAGDESAIVFMGDNVDPHGLPDDDHRLWYEARESISAQTAFLKDYNGRIVFIPGNHDWANGKAEGLEYVKNQRKYIEKELDRDKVFLPKKGRPGPVEVNLTNDIVLIVIDSQWWFHENNKSFAEIIDVADFFVQIEDAISRNKEKKIIFAAHHPVYSVGNHGGNFPFSSNIFPLREINKGLYVPLPGFLYTGFRKFLGIKGDLSHPDYQLFRKALMETFEGHSDIIYAAGHEHNLQYAEKESMHHIISGSAGKNTYVAQNGKAEYADCLSASCSLISLYMTMRNTINTSLT